jgi:phosphoglycerate kinase
MTKFRTIDDLDVAGKRVLLRADFNVPMKDGQVTDRTRIERGALTIAELAKRGAKVAILSHFGRPNGKPVAEMSLHPILPVLSEALGGQRIAFAPDCIGTLARNTIAKLSPGGVALLENLRFHAGEEANDPGFARELAALGDLYVNDAFSCAHRAHASTEGIAHLLPAAAGRLMQEELDHLQKALANPQHPLAAIVGGAKVSTKLELLGNLVEKVDLLIIGGGMANTFLFAEGKAIGTSLAEREMAERARAILAKAKARGSSIALPLDAVVATALKPGVATKTVDIDQVPADQMILDVGPKTVADLNRRLADCRTLVWNGPLGAFETLPFQAGTVAVARQAAALTKAGTLLSVAGGGDTVAALAMAGVSERFSYVSTAGGAFLEWLEGKTLPGVAALAVKA